MFINSSEQTVQKSSSTIQTNKKSINTMNSINMHYCVKCTKSSIPCKCKICRRGSSVQTCIKCYVEIMKHKQFIKNIEAQILQYTTITHDIVSDTANLGYINDILYWDNINIRELSYETYEKISKLQMYCDIFYADLLYTDLSSSTIEDSFIMLTTDPMEIL